LKILEDSSNCALAVKRTSIFYRFHKLSIEDGKSSNTFQDCFHPNDNLEVIKNLSKMKVNPPLLVPTVYLLTIETEVDTQYQMTESA